MDLEHHHSAVGEDAGSTGPLIERVVMFYHKALKSAQKVKSWLKRQGLDNEGLQEQWLMGMADGRLLKSLPTDGSGTVGPPAEFRDPDACRR